MAPFSGAMKDNVKFRPSWSMSSILRRLVSIPRAGLNQHGFGTFLFAIVAGLLTVCIIWGPTVSFSTDAATQPANSIPEVNYELLSNSALNEKSSVAVVGEETENDELQVVEETVSVNDAEETEVRVVATKAKEKAVTAGQLPLVNSKQKWNTSGFSFSPKYTDWDKQRAAYLKKNPNFRPQVGRKTRVMLVTGTSPSPCSRPIGNYLYILGTKNKLDYARLHDIQFYYTVASPDPRFRGWWTKVALVRMLMVNHPDIDWFWWLDSDAWLTDMTFELPFDKYAADGKNLFLYGNEHVLYDEKSWIGINTGDFGIRNCQWSLDLLDAWCSFGLASMSDESGEFLTRHLRDRPENFESDDQSALSYLLIYEKKKWDSKVVLDMSYHLSGDWEKLSPKFEELMEKSHPGFGDDRWPLTVHFAGCQPCTDKEGYGNYPWQSCLDQMMRTFDFAEDQVLKTIGFKLEGKLGGKSEVVPLHGQQRKRVEGEAYHIYPNVSDWDQRRAAYQKKNKNSQDQKGSRPKVLLVSGSGAKECPDSRGTHFLLRALKNKIDYARMHDIDFYYNIANLDKELTGWWMKIPIIRAMMLSHPETEWIWWVDSDAVFTDMVFEPPFASYKDSNLVLWGDQEMVFKNKSFVGVNCGIMLIRNCQWSLDLFDSIVPMGPFENVRDEYGRMLTKFLTDRPLMQADDQSAIVYILNTQKDKYAPKTFFENSYILSGTWNHLCSNFEKMMEEHHPGLGDSRWPLIMHFAGCQPCSTLNQEKLKFEECLIQMDRSLHFADNQVIHGYDLEHKNLGTSELQKHEISPAGAQTKTRTAKNFQDKFH